MDIKITDIAASNPPRKLSQEEVLQIILRYRKPSEKEKALYQRFLLDKGINTRFFASEQIKDIFIEDQDLIIERFQKQATNLSIASLNKCFKQSKVRKEDIDCLLVTTCTGYLCPGLTSYIIERSELRRDIYAVDIVGMGCGGALPAFQGAYNFLNANKDSTALVICTEICSAAISWGADPELILSNSIFGDGSSSCILTNKPGSNGLKVVDFESKILPKHRDKLRFKIENSRLRNVIKMAVPEIAASIVKEITNLLLKKNQLRMNDIAFWAIHPGGRKVLDRIQNTMRLKREDLLYSRGVLYRYGNMSSATVLYILKDILESGRLREGNKIVMASFGAGFSGHSALLTYD